MGSDRWSEYEPGAAKLLEMILFFWKKMAMSFSGTKASSRWLSGSIA